MAERVIRLTPGAMERFVKELERLRSVDRKEVAERIRESKQFGEITENSEYQDAKMQQAMVEGRIMELENILTKAHLIEEDQVTTREITLGCTVTLKDLDTGKSVKYVILDSVEANPVNGTFSEESPVGQAVMGKKRGEEVEVLAPIGVKRYKITKISK